MHRLILAALNGSTTDLGPIDATWDWQDALERAANDRWGPGGWHWDQHDGRDCAVSLDGKVLGVVEG